MIMPRFGRLTALISKRRRLVIGVAVALALAVGGLVAWRWLAEPEIVVVRRRKAPKMTLPRAQELYDAGRYEEALDFCIKHRRYYKDDPAFWNFYGVALRTVGYMEGADDEREEELSAFEKALALDPDFAAARVNLANAFWELGRTEEALAQYRRALAADPGHPDHAGILARFTEDRRLRQMREVEIVRKAEAARNAEDARKSEAAEAARNEASAPTPPPAPPAVPVPMNQPRTVDMNER